MTILLRFFRNFSCPCLAEHCTHIFGSFVRKRPVGVSCCFGTCSTTATVAEPFWPQQQQQGSDMWPHSCQSQTWQTPRWPLGMARPTTDATKNAITQWAIAITAATNMECDINRVCGCQLRVNTTFRDGIRVGKDTREVDRPPWKSRTAILFRSGTFRNRVLD